MDKIRLPIEEFNIIQIYRVFPGKKFELELNNG